MSLRAHLRFLVTALLLAVAVGFAQPGGAQQVNPTADSVKEKQFLDALKGNPSAELQGRVTIPDTKAATLERPAGREWRAFHQNTMTKIGAVADKGCAGRVGRGSQAVLRQSDTDTAHAR